MRLNKFLSLLLLCWLTSGFVFAKERSITVKLVDIKAERTSEKRGDNLYFQVTHYPHSGKPTNERVPLSPLHWVSNQLSQVKNIVLWEGVVHEEETIKLILSLVEEDFPPWDVNDLLGSAQLLLVNQKGKLKQEWSVPHFEKPVEVEMQKRASIQRYLFKGDSSRYDVAFQVEQK